VKAEIGMFKSSSAVGTTMRHNDLDNVGRPTVDPVIDHSSAPLKPTRSKKKSNACVTGTS
jgi:hypothetical protein